MERILDPLRIGNWLFRKIKVIGHHDSWESRTEITDFHNVLIRSELRVIDKQKESKAEMVMLKRGSLVTTMKANQKVVEEDGTITSFLTRDLDEQLHTNGCRKALHMQK